MRRETRGGILRGLRLLLTVAAFAWIARYLDRTAGGLAWPASVDWLRLAACVLLLFVNIPLRALKWRAILRPREPRVTFRESLASYLGAMPLSMITPGRIGEAARALYLPHAALRGWRIAALLAVDKFTDLLAVGLWSVAGFAGIFGTRGFFAALAGLIAAACLPALLLGVPFLGGFREEGRAGAPAAAKRLLAQVVPTPEMLGLRRIAAPLAFGVAAYAVEWLQFALLADAFCEGPVPYLPLAGLTAVIILANAFQITVGGLGVREGLALVLLAPLGIPAEAALAAAFGMFVVGQALPSLAGLAVKPVEAVPEPAPA